MKAALLASVLAVTCPGTVGATEPSTWEGRSADEIVAAWGEPTKIKRDGKGGKVLVYKLRFPGHETVGQGMIHWSDVGIGPPGNDEERQHETYSLAGGPRIGGGQEVVGTRKVKFFVNREGTIYRQELGKFKWKTRPWSPAPCEPAPDPSGPEIP